MSNLLLIFVDVRKRVRRKVGGIHTKKTRLDEAFLMSFFIEKVLDQLKRAQINSFKLTKVFHNPYIFFINFSVHNTIILKKATLNVDIVRMLVQ